MEVMVVTVVVVVDPSPSLAEERNQNMLCAFGLRRDLIKFGTSKIAPSLITVP